MKIFLATSALLMPALVFASGSAGGVQPDFTTSGVGFFAIAITLSGCA